MCTYALIYRNYLNSIKKKKRNRFIYKDRLCAQKLYTFVVFHKNVDKITNVK